MTSFTARLQKKLSLHKSYSQIFEDRLIAALARWYGFSVNTYVDIGCNDPIQLSNTYYFYRLGARGIAVDANPAFESSWRKIRSRDNFIHAAVSSSPEPVTFYQSSSHELSTTHESGLKSDTSLMKSVVSSYKVPCVSLQSLLNSFGESIDLLNIDIEGAEIDALSSNDWSRFRPKVICIEAIDFHPTRPGRVRTEVVDFMSKLGYAKKMDTLLNSIYFDDYLET